MKELVELHQKQEAGRVEEQLARQHVCQLTTP